MAIIFWICTVLGVSVLVCQFIMSLLGLADIDDLETPHDIDHPGGAGHDHAGDHSHHGSNWFFGIITFRTVVAALAFFGLAGLAAQSANLEPAWLPLPIALFVGWSAMYGVHWMMQAMHRLRSEGTARIEYSVGRPGSVYLRIPGQRSGAGKVTLTLQNRTMEYEAMTSGDMIPTGARIVVTNVLGPDMLEVELAPEPEASHV
jgi:hypothetical protein